MLGIAETWRDEITCLHEDYKIIAIKPSIKILNRNSNKEGMIVIGRKEIIFSNIYELTEFGISIKVNSTNLFIFIYRNLSSNLTNIILDKLYEHIDNKIIVIGDYNLEQHKEMECEILDRHILFGLSEINLKTMTYKHGEKTSCPDKVFSNITIFTETKEIPQINHKLIICEIPETILPKTPRYKMNLLKDKAIAEKIKIQIQKYTNNCKLLLKNLEIDPCCDLLHNIILKSTRTIQIRPRQAPRLNDVIQHIRLTREKARKLKQPVYNTLCQEVKNLKKRFTDNDLPASRTKHIGLDTCEFEKILKFHGSATPKTNLDSNRLLNEFVIDSQYKTTEKTIQEINEYYNDKKTKRQMSTVNKIIEVSIKEVTDCISTLKSGKSGGLTGIRNEFLKICPENFIEELTKLYNRIINTHVIPNSWKSHKITPIPKGKDEFRPISLIEKTRKLFEKLILSKFDARLHKQQTGFRTKHSTLNHALCLDTLLRHSNGERICVTLDIKKAYDSVDRNKLYTKLLIQQNFSLNDTELIASMIENNRYTTCGAEDSQTSKTASLGLPQGSIISPTLFNIFINDLVEYLPKHLRSFIFMYADDIIIYGNQIRTIQKIIDSLVRHANHNNYQFNPKKCFYNATKEHQISIYGTRIEKQNPLKYLGFYFNNRNADTKQTLKVLRQRAVRAAVITNKVMRKGIFNTDEKLHVLKLRAYKTFVRPHLDYFSQLLGCNKTFTDESDRIQKGILKYLFKIYYRTPSSIIYSILPIENVLQRCQRLRYGIAHKILRMKNTIVQYVYKKNFSKNLREFKNYYETINRNYSGDDFLTKYKKIHKENLRINFQTFSWNETLKLYNFKQCNRLNFNQILEIIHPVHKRQELADILIKYIQINIGLPTHVWLRDKSEILKGLKDDGVNTHKVIVNRW
ncbi:reverse transcriptase [Hamiltosporidium tvaerminnensis]|uniref:Reverse transcriptase n=1 Tax=Hamiltosporidium tvaerminnensis TaxID=1176355 RepID=A0A4Q9M2Q0_9MICR|nr:reverse transcriptase [Hamiltosporidium tvaerminnensis]